VQYTHTHTYIYIHPQHPHTHKHTYSKYIERVIDIDINTYRYIERAFLWIVRGPTGPGRRERFDGQS